MDKLIKRLMERKNQGLINDEDFNFALSWIKTKCAGIELNKKEADIIINGMLLIIHNESNIYN